jgi:putative spermidine/putrescine transport system substrate-binding protein
VVALADIPPVCIVELALACEALSLVRYVDKGDLTTAEIDATLAVLGEARRNGQFHGMWQRYEQSVSFMADGPVVLQSMWPPAVSALRARNVPLKYRPLREGARGWAGGFALASHLRGRLRAAAMQYINWYQSGWAGAFLTRQGYYSAVPATARKHLTDDEWGYWYEGAAAHAPVVSPRGEVIDPAGALREGGSYEDRMGHIACWSSRMREESYLRRRWKESVRASPGDAVAT